MAQRGAVTCIYFLLKAGQASHWHRVDGVEVWHHYRGAPIELLVVNNAGEEQRTLLGSDLDAGERPQGVVPHMAWQAARCISEDPQDWGLVGCTVSPGFHFGGFELAESGFDPRKK